MSPLDPRPVRCSRRVRLVAVLLVALGVIGVGSGVLAHSGLGAASPGPGAIVGGEVSVIQLRYSSTVIDVEGSVTDPDGNVLDTTFVQEGNLQVSIDLADPLDTPGEYAVRHVSTDVQDEDRVEGAYLFTYDPTAPPPQLEFIPDDDGGFPWVWVTAGVGVVVIAGLAVRLIGTMQRNRQTPRDDATR